MFEFTIPEQPYLCTEEELMDGVNKAREEFSLLNDSDDISDEVLDRMTELADSLEDMVVELQHRRKEQLARSVLGGI